MQKHSSIEKTGTFLSSDQAHIVTLLFFNQNKLFLSFATQHVFVMICLLQM